MKKDILQKLEQFKTDLTTLKKEVNSLKTETVGKKNIRDLADKIASMWVEELRSPLEHQFNIEAKIIKYTAEKMKKLHILSRPNNLKNSYLLVIKSVLYKYDDNFVLPIKQQSIKISSVVDINKIIPSLNSEDESDYLKEAINCVKNDLFRAGIVMGWCAVIDKLQKLIISLGLKKINETSVKIKNQNSGKYKRWKKEFNITTLGELQTVFDNDLIIVLEGLNIFDGNQSDRLFNCFSLRNQSAHPGEAPILEPNVIAFFSDINEIVFQNEKIKNECT
jgi:hypothetical protein